MSFLDRFYATSRNTSSWFIAALLILGILLRHARADDFADRFAGKYPCPTAEPCKILTLTAQEERLLTTQNGILDTAAQARSLDLGQFAVYLKTRIASAPAGEPQKPAQGPSVDLTPKDVKPN